MSRPANLDVFIYLRKSRKDIEEEHKALQNNVHTDTLGKHRKELLELASREGHNIIKVFEEVVSGENLSERYEANKMLQEIEEGGVEAVLVMDLDRLGRGDMYDAGRIFNTFKFAEILIITPSEVIDCTSEGAELLFGIKSIIAREELKQITKRLQGGRRRSATEGKSITRKPPYGYKRGQDLVLYPDPTEEQIVKKIFEMAANGYGRQAILKELELLGIPAPEGDMWEQSTISYIIKNEVYKGMIIWGKQKNLKRNGKYVSKKVSPDKWIRRENAHEPIVTEELWNEANLALKRRYRPPVKEGSSLTNALAGIVKCGVCHRAMYYMAKPNRPNSQLRCINPRCADVQKGVLYYLVEERILESLVSIAEQINLTEEEILSKLQKKEGAIEQQERQIEQILKEKQELEQMKLRAYEMVEKGIYTAEVYLERQNEHSKKMKILDGKLTELSNKYEMDKLRIDSEKTLIPIIKNVLQVYAETDSPEKKNKLLKSVIAEANLIRRKEWTSKDHFELIVETVLPI